MDTYELEKSTDGQQFFKVATLQRTGKSSSESSYNWLDADLTQGTILQGAISR